MDFLVHHWITSDGNDREASTTEEEAATYKVEMEREVDQQCRKIMEK